MWWGVKRRFEIPEGKPSRRIETQDEL